MLTAKEAAIIALENDQTFKHILSGIESAARNGSTYFTHNFYSEIPDGLRMKRYIFGLESLGYEVSDSYGNFSSISVNWSNIK